MDTASTPPARVFASSSHAAPTRSGGMALGAMMIVAKEARRGPQPNSLDDAVTRAGHWVRMSDDRRPDAMWFEAGAMMQRLVPRAEWARYLHTIRHDRGELIAREWFDVTRVRDPVGLPEGDYLNVTFVARFAKAASFETVSLAPGASGWIPVGYVVRPAHDDRTIPGRGEVRA